MVGGAVDAEARRERPARVAAAAISGPGQHNGGVQRVHQDFGKGHSVKGDAPGVGGGRQRPGVAPVGGLEDALPEPIVPVIVPRANVNDGRVDAGVQADGAHRKSLVGVADEVISGRRGKAVHGFPDPSPAGAQVHGIARRIVGRVNRDRVHQAGGEPVRAGDGKGFGADGGPIAGRTKGRGR